MKITFVTELPFIGKVNRNHENMRTEFSWMCALNSDHIPILHMLNKKFDVKLYDLVIVILPKIVSRTSLCK